MKLQMSSNNRAILAAVVLAALGVAFWMMALSPKREEASKLDAQVRQLRSSLAQHESEVAEGEAAKKEFPTDYQHLVVVGKAVPGDDDIASLLVQVNRLAERARGRFSNLQLTASGGEPEAAPAATSSEGTPAPPTEVAASLLPLGATVGTAGLAVMPYNVAFEGDFFQIANFIKGLDALVKTKDSAVTVDGRLLTIDGFSLEAQPDDGFPQLKAKFALTSYLTPPAAASPAGATPEAPPSASEATPAAATIGGAP